MCKGEGILGSDSGRNLYYTQDSIIGKEDLYLFKILILAGKKTEWLKSDPLGLGQWLDIV